MGPLHAPCPVYAYEDQQKKKRRRRASGRRPGTLQHRPHQKSQEHVGESSWVKTGTTKSIKGTKEAEERSTRRGQNLPFRAAWEPTCKGRAGVGGAERKDGEGGRSGGYPARG